jgi:hypothetical protein
MANKITTPTSSRATKTSGIVSLKEKIAYGMGDLGNGFMFDLGQAYLLMWRDCHPQPPPPSSSSRSCSTRSWTRSPAR